MNIRYIAPFLLFCCHVASVADVYFYCVTTTGASYYIHPDTPVTHKAISQPMLNGQVINIGDYPAYTINEKDLEAGQYSAMLGFGTPYVYFVYPAKKIQMVQKLVSDLKEQCKRVIKASNRTDHVFKEVRVSGSFLSGSGLLRPGYPAVFLNIPTFPGEQNVYRIAD